MTVSSAADIIWDGISMPRFDYCLDLAVLADEIEAIERAQKWARSFDGLPADASLRVTVNGAVRGFRLNETVQAR
jgi:hypothetical protein